MLKCQSQIVAPLTKKLSVLRCDSGLRSPFGCSLHKKGAFLYLGNHKHLKKQLKGFKSDFFKDQKKFIWTSFCFLQNDKDDKPTNLELNVEKLSNEHKKLKSNSEKSEKDNSCGSQGLEKNCGENDKINEYSVSEHKTVDGVGNIGDTIKSDSSNVAFNFKQSELNSVQEKSSANASVTVIPCNNKDPGKQTLGETNAVQKPETHSRTGDFACQSIKSDGKRQTFQLNLGPVTDDIKLDPPMVCFNDKRIVKAVATIPETPQNTLIEKARGILRKTASLKADEDGRIIKLINLGPPKHDTNLNLTRRRQTVDLNKCSTERNFITPVRAMTDFLLKPSDLEGLRKTKRRSPYENDPPITVYWRKDVEAKALDVWGSKENLLKEILKRDIERRRYQQNLFTVKRRLRDYRREQGRETEIKSEQNGLFGSSGKVVLTAIAINGTNFLFKMAACLYTGSHSMFSEAVHSLADTINQLILAYGIHKSVQRADSDHPYGYTNMRYVASLISGVGIFCVGSGLSFYHGFVGLTNPSDLPSFYWAYFVLAGSLASEGATLLVAFDSIRKGARKSEMSFSEYVWRGQDPSVNVVLLEDTAAVIGVAFAASCMGLSSYYNSHIPDAIGSFLVGGLLAGVASFIIYTNVAALVGRSIPQERLDKINAELESDVMIRAIHDVKGIDIGNSLVRYKAEMDFDGGELTRSYLDKQDLNQMLEEVKKMNTIDDLEEFMLKHGENIVDMMGGEIDRIELKLRA
ncbi:hypothetical protein RUM44_004943 [Polyplax serrata]|uniref:Proton-coupled zinc antiporter SLC30A9, mitochondrial n=1 Tax=Polyplax serrata TaxID=468196 RepID=A0ABR1AWG0_POLSC